MFAKPERKLTALKTELFVLRRYLEEASKTNDPLTEIVSFFDVISKWHDRGLKDVIMAFEVVNYGQYDEVLENLRTLDAHFSNAGRCQFGWNRTKRGERVTADRVFLGGINGLFTHPVSFWKQGKDEKKGGWGFRNMEHLNAYDVVSQQAKDFMDSHFSSMISIVKELEVIAG